MPGCVRTGISGELRRPHRWGRERWAAEYDQMRKVAWLGNMSCSTCCHSPPFGRCCRTPTPERPGECAFVGIVQKQGDLEYLHCRVFEQLAGNLEANLVCHLAEVGALQIQMTIERAPVHGKRPGSSWSRSAQYASMSTRR